MLKERLFGVSGPQGNHGEDVKELYYYLDSTPTHSYMKFLYKYPQKAYPYEDLVRENQHRGREVVEFEILDTDVFDEDRYWDVFVEVSTVLLSGRVGNSSHENLASSTQRMRIVLITFTSASPHIIVVPILPICISSLNCGFRIPGLGASHLKNALICPPPQKTRLLQFMTSSGRHTCIVFRPPLLSDPTVNLSTTVPKVKKTR
jgi:hypothetical protein